MCCRGPSSFPCSERVFRRHPRAQLLLERAHLPGGLRELRAEAFGLPDLKLVAEAREGDGLRDARMLLERFRQDHPALAVDLERLAGPVERGREILALVG